MNGVIVTFVTSIPLSQRLIISTPLQFACPRCPSSSRPTHRPLRPTRITSVASNNPSWKSSSTSALNYDSSSDINAIRCIDLRTMKVILPDDAHLTPPAPSNISFSPVGGTVQHHNHPNSVDPLHPQSVRHLLFTADTLPLSDSQKNAIHALLSHRSVLYTSATADDKHSIFLDIVMRSRVWKKSVVYAASSRRAAESMFATLCVQLGPERRNEVLLDLGDGYSQRANGSPNEQDKNNPTRVVITTPTALRTAIINLGQDTWLESTSVLFVDSVNDSSINQWEEVLLSLPSTVLVCLLSRQLTRAHLELLPIWVETIQNVMSTVSPLGPCNVLSRIEQPQNMMPLLRTFAYNAASHTVPVQVSLSILRELLKTDIDQSGGDSVFDFDSIPNYAKAFLHGVTILPAEDPKQLLFRNAAEAAFADFCALIIADAKRTQEAMRTRSRRRRRKESSGRATAATRAAARRRRDTAYTDSLLLPAIALVKGHAQVMECGRAIQSALGDVQLVWDDDTREHIEGFISSLQNKHHGEFMRQDLVVLELLTDGIGVVNDMYTPSLRIAVEELFRAGLIPLVIVDTHLGSEELGAFSTAKSVLVEAGSLASCDDMSKGLIAACTAAGLAGRLGKDGVGNLIALWYDEAVDDESAGYDIATTLLSPELTPEIESPSSTTAPQRVKPYEATDNEFTQPFGELDSFEVRSGTQSVISSCYDSVLRSLRRFGLDGYESLYEYTLSSFKGWLKRAALHATLEKMGVEKTAMDERLGSENWNSISDYERKTAKVNEVQRVLNAMTKRVGKVMEQKMLNELKKSTPGRIIQLRMQTEEENNSQKELSGTTTTNDVQPKSEKVDNDSNLNKVDSDGTKIRVNESSNALQLVKEQDYQSGKLTSAVFVMVFDQDAKGKHIDGLDSRYLVVCITADGLWTMIPASTVEAISDESEEPISNVDLLVMPHPATFDIEPGSSVAKCAPVDEGEQAALHRVSDQLIACVTGMSETPPRFVHVKLPEFEEQREHARLVEKMHRQSEWYGRDTEVKELRWLRRRAAELGDEMESLSKRKEHVEERITETNNDRRSVQSSLMAVLEDCHALSFRGDSSIEITPIGALASILSCEYPVFAAACLCLIDDIESLTVPQFAAFVTIIATTGRVWKQGGSDLLSEGTLADSEADDNEMFHIEPLRDSSNSGGRRGTDNRSDNMDMLVNGVNRWGEGSSDVSKLEYESGGGNGIENGEDDEMMRETLNEDRRLVHAEAQNLKGLLPSEVAEMVAEIQQALHQLHRRHLSECQAVQRVWVHNIVPTMLNYRLARAAMMFADGTSWREIMDTLGNEGGYAMRELRKVMAILDFIGGDEQDGEFTSATKELARNTLSAMNRWPVRDHDTLLEMVDSGFIERRWSGNTYDKWWRSVRDTLRDSVDTGSGTDSGTDSGYDGESNADTGESVEAEIVET